MKSRKTRGADLPFLGYRHLSAWKHSAAGWRQFVSEWRARRAGFLLLTLTKVFPAETIREAYGENYVPEFEGKAPQLADLEDARLSAICSRTRAKKPSFKDGADRRFGENRAPLERISALFGRHARGPTLPRRGEERRRPHRPARIDRRPPRLRDEDHQRR